LLAQVAVCACVATVPAIAGATAPATATFTYPVNGSATVSTAQAFTWTAAADAQAYYLYVGTTQGSSNLVNSGGIASSVTSYGVPALPTGETLWARLYTEVNGAWVYYQDISFQVSLSASRLSSPYAGQTNFDSRSAFTWAPAPDAQAYYLNVGTTVGGNDVFSSGELPTSQTSLHVPNLPIGVTLDARLYTEIDGAWTVYTDTAFVNSFAAPTVTYPNPALALTNEDMNLPVTWTSVPGATSYDAWIGTSEGSSNIKHSGGLPSTQTSYLTGPLPVGETLWLRVWALVNGIWVYKQDVPFTAAGMITAPAQQATAVNPAKPFTWAPGATLNGVAPDYELEVGTSPGAANLFKSAVIATDSDTVPVADLPSGEPLYARVIYFLGDGSQRRIDNVFTVQGTTLAPAQMNWGAGGSAAVDTSQPFQWSASPLDQAYRLTILSGTTTVAASGTIRVPEYFDEALPVGSYTAQLGTEIAGAWQWTTAPFTVTSSGTSASNEVAAAHWATDYVRQMADLSNYAYGWTELYSDTAVRFPRRFITCGVYAWELTQILKQMNVAASLPAAEQPTIQDIYFINGGDGHVIVYFYDTAQSNWIVLDPTFDIAMQDTGSGAWATAQDAYQAAVSRNWSAITYVPLGSYGWAVADGYYLDYPLLYLNIPPEPAAGATENDPTPYLTLQSSWPSNRTGLYILQATGGQPTTTVIVNGSTETLATDLAKGFSIAFKATSVALPAGSTQTANLYSLDRYVFTGSGGPA
jgi:hypothetical protein